MALTTGRYQTCPTAPTPRGYLLIAFLNHTEQAIATGLQTADKELQGLVWAGGWGLGVCSGVAASALLCVYFGCAFVLLCPLGASSFLGVPCSGQMGRVRRPGGESLSESSRVVAKWDPKQAETGQGCPYLGKPPFPNIKAHKGHQ